jgi:hypothetical protein
MSPEEREQNRQMVEEAKRRDREEPNADFINLVRGADNPSQEAHTLTRKPTVNFYHPRLLVVWKPQTCHKSKALF